MSNHTHDLICVLVPKERSREMQEAIPEGIPAIRDEIDIEDLQEPFKYGMMVSGIANAFRNWMLGQKWAHEKMLAFTGREIEGGYQIDIRRARGKI